jgi:hypothetical protein
MAFANTAVVKDELQTPNIGHLVKPRHICRQSDHLKMEDTMFRKIKSRKTPECVRIAAELDTDLNHISMLQDHQWHHITIMPVMYVPSAVNQQTITITDVQLVRNFK